MDNVILLPQHMKSFAYVSESGGGYTNGIWVDGTKTDISFTAAPFPISEKEMSLLPQGELSFNDIKIYTKYDISNAINKSIKRTGTTETFSLYNVKPFKEIADLKIYILKRVEGES